MGRSRTRIPTASCTAAATAASTPVAPSSPMPRAPIRLAASSNSSTNETSMSAGMSALNGTATLDRLSARTVAVDGQRPVGQCLPEPPAVHGLLVALLHRRLAPAPDDRADHLRPRRERVDDAARGGDADPAPQTQDAEVRVHPHLDEDHAPGAHGVGRALAVAVEHLAAGQLVGALDDEL